MTPESLDLGFQSSQGVLEANLDGISEEESRRAPGPAGNCLNWLAGHILVSRLKFGTLVGIDNPMSDEELAPYGRGSRPLQPGEPALSLAKLVDELRASSVALTSKIRSMKASELAAPIDGKYFPFPVANPDLGKLLTILLFHESYHCGQTGLARRLLGKPSGIGI